MRRVVILLLSVFAIVGMLAPPVFAQAPAPQVTINGLVDFVTTIHRNWSGGTCNPGCDVTDGGIDRGWYSRERGVFTITGEVGKAKGVLSLEFDFHQGQTEVQGATATTPVAASGTSAGTDLDTDVPGFAEMKWLYVEVPFTGPGSLLPFIPAASILRGGAQPARGHDYKNGILLSGDLPGVTIETTWAPNLRSTVTYVQAREALDRVTAPGAFESYALVASVELDVYKGFTVKPTYAYAEFTGGSGQASLGNPNTSGNVFNNTATTLTNARMWRSTLGGDIRWTAGPLSIQPTVFFQWGEQECTTAVSAACTSTRDVKIRTGIIDVIGGYRMGPLNIELRGMFTPGNKANEVVSNGDDINYFRGINPGFGYMAGWTDIQTSGVEYNTALLAGAPGVSLRTSPSYDKYGRIFLAGAADYALTPALTLTGLLNASWAAEKVDTNGVLSADGITSTTTSSGDSRYLGTEVNAKMTYRFAPNVAFDLIGAYLFTGAAMDHQRATTAGSDREEADDVYKLTARVRFTF
jgi:hypothetical protein